MKTVAIAETMGLIIAVGAVVAAAALSAGGPPAPSGKGEAAAMGGAAGAGEALSRAPLDIVLDYNYGTGHLHNGAGAPLYPEDRAYWEVFRRELRRAPPEILIVGKEAPFTHSLGPIASYGGENQTFPSIGGQDGRYRLSPEQLRQRIAAIRRFVEEAHAAGVRKVAPYVSLITMFGDAEKRSGFWEFYDHWDDYARAFDLGPRPPGDPLDWTQRDRDGNVYFNRWRRSSRRSRYTRRCAGRERCATL